MTPAPKLEAAATVDSFSSLPEDFFTRLDTRPLRSARLLHANPDVARSIGLDAALLDTPEFAAVVSGERPLPGGVTLSAVYSGHQFGVWAGQLGDGRAHLLGEVGGPLGPMELQLKGAGHTPYSRMGDGRAVLRSSVREYLAGEAMHGLGIPTTRALALVTSSDPVVRETVETAAIVTRVAPSFVRFGSFEHWAANKRPDHLRTLADYVIRRYFPECWQSNTVSGVTDYAAWLQSVAGRTADMIAAWQVTGFCHGVMNTDNMSILGLTLDYGPYGFMDAFDARHICNHTDTNGRYAWNAQPAVAQWNLFRLAASLRALIPDEDVLRGAVGHYETSLLAAMQRLMRRKLGLLEWREDDDSLLDDLWRLMHENHADFTLSFRQLAHAPGLSDAPVAQIEHDLGGTAGAGLVPFVDLFADREAAQTWLSRYRDRVLSEGRPWQARVDGMLASNPLYVLRNYLAQRAIESAQKGDATEIDRLLRLLSNPFSPAPGMESYAGLPPEWATHIEVSCSS